MGIIIKKASYNENKYHKNRYSMESDGGTRCSSCKKKVHDTTNGCYEPVDLSEMPYCPKCGAIMDGD